MNEKCVAEKGEEGVRFSMYINIHNLSFSNHVLSSVEPVIYNVKLNNITIIESYASLSV